MVFEPASVYVDKPDLRQHTAPDVISLAINVVQNRQDCRELPPDLAYLLGGSAAEPQGRGHGGAVPTSDAIRMMLEELYREILRPNGLGPARALTQLTDEGDPEPDK